MTMMIVAAAIGVLILATGWAALKVAADSDDLAELQAQVEHRRKVDSLARIHIDVGRQRPIQPEASFTLAGKDRGCVMDDCYYDAAVNSDFCGPCRRNLTGGAA